MDTSTTHPIFSEIVRQRYSCRKYSPQPVSRQTVLDILEAARLAPSACNKQPWKFVVAEAGLPLHKAVTEAYDRPWVAEAPTFIIACGLHEQAWHRADGKDHTDIDVAIAVEHICLAATALGLATCWICNFDKNLISTALQLAQNVEPIAIIPLGFPSPHDHAPEKKRKEMDSIVGWEKF